MLSLEAVPLRVGGGSRDNCPWPSKKLKLSCSAVCCNDTKVKFRRSSFLLADPGPVLALGGPGWKYPDDVIALHHCIIYVTWRVISVFI